MLGMLKKYTVELSPEVHGKISNNGSPIENLLIERSLTYADEEYLDNCLTNANGEFSFEAKSIKSRLPGNILHEPVVRQVIEFTMHDHDSETYIWATNQHDITCPTICKTHLSNLTSDISNEEEVFELTNVEAPEYPLIVRSNCSL
ncbi:hypothetical protein Q4601_14355 [Shewanella sp. 1_MG-2023]|uniref:DUF6795 domain-containing protein n=1 Tax=unclassified Shewanella TaxID=196818 RepID=UPI0026E3D380|nr:MULTISPECIES: DUF6795 domain-containing protein [unclassified Shewanella]MDO6611391.1 hypothetical protein [Shewanella sp. 7_MG-2023]MDO6771246.1 hypothetical protein [Shewanella sp. 2_MG-2023]MDO6795487.1 hypothetical protein [Shewanella sp. 1_MG-2023]